MVRRLQGRARTALLQVPPVVDAVGSAGRAEQLRAAVDPDGADRGSDRPPLGDPYGTFRAHHLEHGQ
nr:MAG TPA: hypothetical protein [Caudoviricetes sp.]